MLLKVMKVVAILLGVIIVVLLGILLFVNPVKSPTVTSTAGPAVSSDGNLAVLMPHADDLVDSPVAIEGTVTDGEWFFEGSFPIEVVDGDGTVIGQGTAQALSDWMSTGSVPFSASISFTAPREATGSLVFTKDDPSGDPANGGSFELPVRFR